MTTNDFLLPDLGEGLTEAAIVHWLVAEGDRVETDQPVVELESAKSVVELPTPFAGIVTRLHGAVGDVMLAGNPLLSVASGADAGATPAPDASEAQPAPTGGAAHADPVDGAAVDAGSGAVLVGYGTTEPERRRTGSGRHRFGSERRTAPAPAGAPTGATTVSRDGSGDEVEPATTGADRHIVGDTAATIGAPAGRSPVVSPIVRRLAREHGFDAATLRGSGPGGLVRRDDVDAAIASRAAAACDVAGSPGASGPAGSPGGPGTTARPIAASSDTAATGTVVAPRAAPGTGAPGATERFVPFTSVQSAAAAHFVRSRTTIPEVTIWLDVDATPLLDARARIAEASGERYGLTALVSRFALAALRRFPRLNASVDESRGGVVEYDEVHLGIAAQTARGLMVPVVHGASAMTTRELRDAIGELVVAAGEGAFPPATLRGGTFTVNNYGGFGVDGSTPIINHPEVAMLGIGRLVERPWVVSGELAVRRVLTLSLTFDHRVCDGQVASAFLTSVAANIEEPLSLLADV